MKQSNKLILGLSAFFLSSCGMTWDNGGKKEYRTHCESHAKYVLDDYNSKDESFETTDIDKTCNCVIEKMKTEYPSYEDALLNLDKMDALIKLCGAASN